MHLLAPPKNSGSADSRRQLHRSFGPQKRGPQNDKQGMKRAYAYANGRLPWLFQK